MRAAAFDGSAGTPDPTARSRALRAPKPVHAPPSPASLRNRNTPCANGRVQCTALKTLRKCPQGSVEALCSDLQSPPSTLTVGALAPVDAAARFAAGVGSPYPGVIGVASCGGCPA